MPKRRPRRKFGPSQRDRIFFACLPDETTANRVHAMAQRWKAKAGLESNLILPEHLHVTLFHLGDWAVLPEEIVRLAREAADAVSAAPFEVVFSRAESFRNSTGIYPFVLTNGVEQWRPLHPALGDALKKVGLGGATQGEFKPHLTLAYDRIRVKPFAFEPCGWAVRDFVLVHSQLGRTAHTHLGRWSLRG